MISVRFLGHIKTAMGSEEVELPQGDLSIGELIELLRTMAKGGERPGFSKFNTLVVVNEGEALPASQEGRLLKDGDSVLLVPISHGG
jgi:molybdopterin converting factor small subunit